MTKTEKRYFSLNSKSQEGSKGYLALFQEMDKMAAYDEARLKERLKQLGFNTDHLAVDKVNLTKLILRSLRSFHEGGSPEHSILSMLAEADILKNKGLYNHAKKHLDKAKTTARNHEMHFIIGEVLNRQAELGIDLFDKGTPEKLELLYEEIERHKLIIQKETEMRLLANKMFLMVHTKPLKSPATIASIDEIAENEMLQSINDTDSFFAKLNYFMTHATIKLARGEYASANPFYLKILELWDRYPQLRKLHARLFKTHIANYLNSCHTLGKYEMFDQWLDRFFQIEDTNFNEEAGSFKDFYHINLLYLLNTTQLRRALEIVPTIEEGLVKYKVKINKARETALRFNVFITYFINEKFSEALDCLQKMELDTNFEPKADTRSLARIMRIIVHYELGHSQMLDYLRTSVYRKLKKREQLHEFERTMLDHIKNLEEAAGIKETKDTWLALLKNLERIGETYGKNTVAGLEEITCWAESRLYKKPYVQVLEEKKQR